MPKRKKKRRKRKKRGLQIQGHIGQSPQLSCPYLAMFFLTSFPRSLPFLSVPSLSPRPATWKQPGRWICVSPGSFVASLPWSLSSSHCQLAPPTPWSIGSIWGLSPQALFPLQISALIPPVQGAPTASVATPCPGYLCSHRCSLLLA